MSTTSNELARSEWQPGYYDPVRELVNVDGDLRTVCGMSKALDTAAAAMLVSEMSRISEDCWCAAWLSGLGFSLWDRTQYGGPAEWGQGEVNAADLNRLLDLAVKAGGWWHWPESATWDTDLTFYTLDEWTEVRNRAGRR